MAVDESLGKRSVQIRRKEDITPENLEKALSDIEGNMKRLDQRRIAQLETVSEGSTDADTIQNLLTGINAIINALNRSDLTNN